MACIVPRIALGFLEVNQNSNSVFVTLSSTVHELQNNPDFAPELRLMVRFRGFTPENLPSSCPSPDPESLA